MATPLESDKHERPSTYFVPDQRNKEELTRLLIQNRMLTASMGGVLPEQADPRSLRRVLDVGCGTGGWAVEAAKTYPSMSLVGIDLNERMVEHAREHARGEHVADRVSFRLMDALSTLDFPPACFDLVNLRMGVGFVRLWDWPRLLSSFQRVTRLGGCIRLTECNAAESNSPAQTRLVQLLHQAFYHAGNYFRPQNDGLTSELAHLLRRHGLTNVQTENHQLIYRAGTPQGHLFAEATRYLSRTLRPFIHKWTRLPEDYDALCRQALIEMQRTDFVATWEFVTAWGTVCDPLPRN